MNRPFPLPPDIEPTDTANPHAPVRFERGQLGRETAWLGSILIGEVIPNLGGRLQRATVLMYLPDTPRKSWGASNMVKGRDRLVNEAREWIAAAGLAAS